MAKRTKAVRAELVVRMPSVEALRREIRRQADALVSVVDQLEGLRLQLGRVESTLDQLAAELIPVQEVREADHVAG